MEGFILMQKICVPQILCCVLLLLYVDVPVAIIFFSGRFNIVRHIMTKLTQNPLTVGRRRTENREIKAFVFCSLEKKLKNAINDIFISYT